MKKLDLTGLKCPLPVLQTQKALGTMSPGARLQVITTDSMSVIDIPHFCTQNGHGLIETEWMEQGCHRFVIEKAQS